MLGRYGAPKVARRNFVIALNLLFFSWILFVVLWPSRGRMQIAMVQICLDLRMQIAVLLRLCDVRALKCARPVVAVHLGALRTWWSNHTRYILKTSGSLMWQ